MTRHIPNAKKLNRILEQHQKHAPKDDPFAFSMDEALRIRQLIGESLVAFFAKLHDQPSPGPQSIPPGTPGTETESKPKPRRRY